MRADKDRLQKDEAFVERTNEEIVPPLLDWQPLPSMITLYRRDRAELPIDDLDARLYNCLDLPPKIACSICAIYPKLWSFVMDFVQEGNIKLLQAHAECDPNWSFARFRCHVAAGAKGSIFQYLSHTFDIYIPPTMRHRMVKERDQGKTVEWLEHHVSWEALLECKTNVPDTTTPQPIFDSATRMRVVSLLDQLPSRERWALSLWYGFDDYPHTSKEIGILLGIQTDHAKRVVNTAIKRLQHGQVQQAREFINKDRQERLQMIYDQHEGHIGVVELSLLAKVHTTSASKFLKSLKSRV